MVEELAKQIRKLEIQARNKSIRSGDFLYLYYSHAKGIPCLVLFWIYTLFSEKTMHGLTFAYPRFDVWGMQVV